MVLARTLVSREKRRGRSNFIAHATQVYMYLVFFSAWSRARHGQCLVSVISINWLWAYPGSLTGTVRLSLGTQHACYCWRRREREMAGLWFLLRRNGNFRCTNRRQCWKVSSDKRWEMFLLIFTSIRTCSTYYLKASAIIVNSLFVMQVLQFKCFDVLYY